VAEKSFSIVIPRAKARRFGMTIHKGMNFLLEHELLFPGETFWNFAAALPLSFY